ncbi:MAG: terminase small subunit [Oscillospiraceae bacterium]|nr:terminase small subunit [Oscillospiraceae bacterium]
MRAGYSPRSAQQIAEENMRKPVIANAVARAMAERSKRTGINQDRVLLELAKLGFVNATDVINMDEATIQGTANRDDTAAIQSVKVKRIPTEDGGIVEREVRLHDKLKALEQMGRHLGMFDDKLRLDGAVSLSFVDDLESE